MKSNDDKNSFIEANSNSAFKKRLLIYFGTVGVLLFYAASSFVLNLFLNFNICPVNAIFGIPCPGCGMSRAVFYAITLNFEKAFAMHPLFVLVPVVFALYSCLYLFKNKSVLSNKVSLYIFAGILIVTYIVRMIIFFPGEAPMEFNEKSLVGLIIKILNK